MIGMLKGRVADMQPPVLIIDVQGVGYEVEVPSATLSYFANMSDEITLYTHMVVREDAQILYGFSRLPEKQLFRQLIKVNGVGPKLALTILSGMSYEDLVQVVGAGDIAAFTRLPGVGKKTAERLMIELKDKLKEAILAEVPHNKMAPSDQGYRGRGPVQEAIGALITLGYKPQEANKAISSINPNGMSSEELIRQALKGMV